MATKEQFLPPRTRSQLISLPQEFSDEERARDWTLSGEDRAELRKYRTNFRLFLAVQLCAVRLYGRFLQQVQDLSPRIINYLGSQLGLPPSLTIEGPDRKATYSEQRKHFLDSLGFQKFDEQGQAQLETWLEQQARLGMLPEELFQHAEKYLVARRIFLPGPSVLERLIIHICSAVHEQLFAAMFQHLSPDVRQAIDHLLTVPEGEQRSYFYRLKEYPPAATISSLQTYLQRYHTLSATGIAEVAPHGLTPAFLEYLFKLAKRHSTTDLKRFADHKRYALMLGFLLETRKVLLDPL